MSAHGRYSRSTFGAPVSRRGALKTFGGAAGLAALAPLLEACSSSSSSGSSGGSSSGGGTVTFGSNYSDASPKAAFAGMIAAAQAATGLKVTINTVDHNSFQNNINTYLQGTPDDLFTWFAGYRMQFFAAQSLAHQLDDVWSKIGSSFSSSIQAACKGLDGHYYIVPIYNYPWVVFYRKSVFQAKGYTVPTTWDEFTTLLKKAQSDGLIPLAFADKDGWPALGTFDILNMRINGYDFHMQLMKHKVPWTDSRVGTVFQHWQEILPYMQSGANGRTWEESATTFENKQAAMMFQGTDQVAAAFSAADLPDLDFFPYPTINTAYGQDSIDAPIDGFMMAANPKNHDGAVKLLEYIGTAAAEKVYLSKDSSDVGVATNMNTSGYNAVQQKSVEIIKSTKNIAQFMDRDTDPGFADTVMIPAIQSFINSPGNYSSMLKSVEAQAASGQYFQTS
jgi:multiple sugar transport system substrate-binding protein